MSEIADTGERLISEGNEQTLTYGEHISRYLSVQELTKGKVVLDVASGTGYGTKVLAQHSKRVIGIDYSEEAIAYSREHNNAKNIEYIVGDAHNMPLTQAAVDTVISFETIEHLPKPAKFIEEVKRVLTPGGVFVVSTPNDDEFMEGNQFHVHEFDLAELKRLITRNFKYSRFFYQGTYFSAALLSEQAFTRGGTWDGLTHKTFPQPTNKAIFFIAVASDKPLDDLKITENVVLADAWSTKNDIEHDNERQKTLKNLQASIQEVAEKYNVLKADRDALENQLSHIHDSKAWKLARLIRTPLVAARRIHKPKQ